MNKVTTIHLAGRSYTLEEAGYSALRAYLDEAAAKLESNPDKEEILNDFDAAISEKCDTYLTSTKNVITEAEVAEIIKQMGPVENLDTKEDGSKEKTSENKSSEKNPPKKLYQIREGAIISGVCNGLAVYFDLDVLLVRILFVIFTIITHGAGIGVYILMMIFVPHADTPEDKAQAFGTNPITAKMLLQKAKDGYNNFKNSRDWRQMKRNMRQEAKMWKHKWKYEVKNNQYRHQPSPMYEIVQSIIGMAWVVLLAYGCWFGYNHIAPVHQLFDLIGQAWTILIQKLALKMGIQ